MDFCKGKSVGLNFLMPGSKGQNAVHACMIRHVTLRPAKHEKVAIYAVNRRISNILKEGVSMTYKDYKQSLNQKLAGKVQQELLNFQKEIQEKTPREVYDMAQQTFIKEEIAKYFLHPEYSPQAAKALLKSSNLLHEIYEEWLECGEGNTDSLRQIIADFKNYMVQTEKVLSGRER